MDKEKIELFEQKRLPAPEGGGSERSGGLIMRTLALGLALFSLIFIFCCFGMGMSRQDYGPETADPAQMSNLMEQVLAAMRSIGRTGEEAGTTSAPDTGKSPADTTRPLPIAPVYDIYAYDPSAVPAGHTAIRPYDLSLRTYGDSFIYNTTSYSSNTEALLKLNTLPQLSPEELSGAPVVLIIHTHGTEAYSPQGSISYDGVSTLARSEDITRNVVAVGQAMADVLNGRGISTLHCEIMHDVQSYRDSYSRSAATIKEYIDKYPSIKYVIDVHRDSVSDSSGALLRPVTLVNGNVAAAQVMCVVGSDAGGTACPRWQENLSFALRLRSALNSSYGNICRPVCLRGSAYNQQYAPVSLLLEIGASGNYLDEALEAGRLCADALADLIIG